MTDGQKTLKVVYDPLTELMAYYADQKGTKKHEQTGRGGANPHVPPRDRRIVLRIALPGTGILSDRRTHAQRNERCPGRHARAATW